MFRKRGCQVWAVDNLSRLGSNLNVATLQSEGINVVRANVDRPDELEGIPKVDAIISCAAEPSVLAGIGESPCSAINTNLVGTLNCLELARKWNAAFLFMSTSRVYSIAALQSIAYRVSGSRFQWDEQCTQPGFSSTGIAEGFSTTAPISIYGATKIASETMIAEYRHTYGIRTVINRFGVVSGPGQMGRSDQGVVALWVARHLFGQPLTYKGFGGNGYQVRDVLHVADLCDLVAEQLTEPDKWDGTLQNVGGGHDNCVSLYELTQLCNDVVGKRIEIGAESETTAVDIPIYISDNRLIQSRTSWKPKRSVDRTVSDIAEWISTSPTEVRRALGE